MYMYMHMYMYMYMYLYMYMYMHMYMYMYDCQLHGVLLESKEWKTRDAALQMDGILRHTLEQNKRQIHDLQHGTPTPTEHQAQPPLDEGAGVMRA
jgi:hypothetical protein